MGILLTVCKGLGKCCSVGELLLDRDIPPTFLITCIKCIVLRPEIDPDCDATHIILELILKLIET